MRLADPLYGSLPAPCIVPRVVGREMPIPRSGPDVGEHNREIYAAFGVGELELEALRAEGVVLIMRRVQLFGVVANALWPQRVRLWDRLAGDLKPDFTKLMSHVHSMRLEDVLEHAALQLQGATSGRTIVTFPEVS